MADDDLRPLLDTEITGEDSLRAFIADAIGLEPAPDGAGDYWWLTRDEAGRVLEGVDLEEEVDVLTERIWKLITAARAERDEANAQAARAIAAQNEAVREMDGMAHRYGRLDAAIPTLRLRLRQATQILAGKRDVGDWREDAWAALNGTADLDLSEGGHHG